MTFLEAAVAILKREGRPLSYKTLTEIALKENLLTVVGRSPEATMQKRLDDALKTDDPGSLLTRDKPGTVGLRYYPPRAQAEAELAALAPPPPAATVAVTSPAASSSEKAPAATGKSGDAPAGEERKRRRRRGGRGRRKEATDGAATSAAGTGGAGDDDDDEDDIDAAIAKKAARAVAAKGEGSTAREPAPSGPPPQRHSFAEAAAVVAAAHRRRNGEGSGAGSAGAEESSVSVEASARPASEAPATVEHNGESARPHAAHAASAPHHLSTEQHAATGTAAGSGEMTSVVSTAARGGAELDGDESDDDVDFPSGPLIAPAFGTEELVRGEDHRNVVEEGGRSRRRRRERGHTRGPGQGADQNGGRDGKGKFGSDGNRGRPQQGQPAALQHQGSKGGHGSEAGQHRDPRGGSGRSDRGERPRGAESHGHRPASEHASASRPAVLPPTAKSSDPRQPIGQLTGAHHIAFNAETAPSPVDAVVAVLRSGDGRPVHLRQIMDMAIKRKLLRGETADLVRLVRAAVVAEAREREASGRRPRVRSVGGGSYALSDRRLEEELATQERELGERAQRLSDATRTALHARITQLPASSFEALGRLVMLRLGVSITELVKRGEGVAYFGGERVRGGQKRNVLVALRPGGAGEISRRAVGELRTGIKARSFDEGILVAASRAGAEALDDLAMSGGSIEILDGETLAATCARHGVGVVKRSVSVDALDIELLTELTEG